MPRRAMLAPGAPRASIGIASLAICGVIAGIYSGTTGGDIGGGKAPHPRPVPSSSGSSSSSSSSSSRPMPSAGAAYDSRSCAEARAVYTQTPHLLDTAAAEKPVISFGTFGAKLDQGTYLQSCGVPSKTRVDICAAILRGKVIGATVELIPRDPVLANCVDRAVRATTFLSSPQLDISTTTYE